MVRFSLKTLMHVFRISSVFVETNFPRFPPVCSETRVGCEDSVCFYLTLWSIARYFKLSSDIMSFRKYTPSRSVSPLTLFKNLVASVRHFVAKMHRYASSRYVHFTAPTRCSRWRSRNSHAFVRIHCESWCDTLRKEYKLQMYEKAVLRKKYGTV